MHLVFYPSHSNEAPAYFIRTKPLISVLALRILYPLFFIYIYFSDCKYAVYYKSFENRLNKIKKALTTGQGP
jgi:hypothetical protein